MINYLRFNFFSHKSAIFSWPKFIPTTTLSGFHLLKLSFKQNLTGYLEMDQHIDTGILSHFYAFLRKGDINVCFVFHGKSKHLKFNLNFIPQPRNIQKISISVN